MVSSKTASYADRIKSGRASVTSPVAKVAPAQSAPLKNLPNSYLATATIIGPSVGLSSSAATVETPIPSHVPNGIDSTATSRTNNPHHPATSSDPSTNIKPALNGAAHADPSSSPLPDPSSTPPPKQNVWALRKEQMAARSGQPQPFQSQLPASSQSQSHPSTTPSTPPERMTASTTALDSQSSIPNQSAMNHAGGLPSKYPKKKVQTKPATGPPQASPNLPPSFDEKSSWPAPNEASPSGNNTPNSSGRKENATPPNEVAEQPGTTSHSRDSSTAGTGGHGKKQNWVRVPTSDFVADVATSHPSSPHSRGRHSVDGDVKKNGRSMQPGLRNSGQTSKKSSAAPSPAFHHPLLPLTPSGNSQPLNANAPVFSMRGMPNPLLVPAATARSHPHSPLTRSPYHSSRIPSLVNSPRATAPGSFASPKNYQQHPLPPNPTQAAPTPPRKKVRRPTPSKAAAVVGDIPQMADVPGAYKPVFGSIGAADRGDSGLGLAVDGEENSSGAGSRSHTAEATPDVIRWSNEDRKLSIEEQILKTAGKFGIGVGDVGPPVQATQIQPPTSDGTASQEPLRLVISDQPPEDSQEAADTKWAFGSLDKTTATNLDIMTVDPTRSPTYGLPYPAGTAAGGGNVTGYPPYDPRGMPQPQYGPPFEGGPGGYPQAQDAPPNGYGPRGMGPRRGRGRGGYAGRGGGFGHRGSVSNGYRNGNIPSPQSQPYYGYPPQYDMGMPMQYPPIMPVDYSNPDPYGPPGSVPPPTPASAHPDPNYAPYSYGYPPPMAGMPYPPPPVPYYPPYAPGMPAGIPPYYGAPPFAPLPYPPSGPPMPTPITNIPYLDPIRYAVLGQVEYYFSPQNIHQDSFLRKQMDSQGWIPINTIASFNRMRSLSTDVAMIRDTMALSALIEVSPDGESCRMAGNAWEPYVVQLSDHSMSQQTADNSSAGASSANVSQTEDTSVGSVTHVDDLGSATGKDF